MEDKDLLLAKEILEKKTKPSICKRWKDYF